MTSNHFFEQISNHYSKGLPFVVYRKPKKDEVKAILQNNTALNIASDYKESGFVFAPFDNKNDTILLPIDTSSVLSLSAFKSDKDKILSAISHPKDDKKSEYISLIKKGIETINNHKFDKVVVSRFEEVTCQNHNPIHYFKRLLQLYSEAFTYCWFHPKVGLWLGATPETLLNVEGKLVKTMSLAGTQPYSGTLDVKWHEKERKEQQIVTDFILSNLKHQVENINVARTETIKAGSLLHLRTKISGRLESDLKTIIEQLHPTPAICGFPRESAKEFILNNENYNREFYTGFLGELNMKHELSRNKNKRNIENNAYTSIKSTSSLFVNLRCMKLDKNLAKLFVGGGITKDSRPEKEWEETVNKTKTMAQVIAF